MTLEPPESAEDHRKLATVREQSTIAALLAAVIKDLPKILLPPAIVVALHACISLGFSGYDRVPVMDIPMHFLGGVVIAWSGALLLGTLEKNGAVSNIHSVVVFGFLLCFVTTAATVWEFTEFVSDRLFDTGAQKGLEDTLGDMLVGMLGGIGPALVAAARWSNRR